MHRNERHTEYALTRRGRSLSPFTTVSAFIVLDGLCFTVQAQEAEDSTDHTPGMIVGFESDISNGYFWQGLSELGVADDWTGHIVTLVQLRTRRLDALAGFERERRCTQSCQIIRQPQSRTGGQFLLLS